MNKMENLNNCPSLCKSMPLERLTFRIRQIGKWLCC